MDAAIRVRDLRKGYGATPVLDVPALDLGGGEQAALLGTSGGGKTTLLHVLAGITAADAGTVLVAGVDVTRLGEAARDRHRARHVGYVFQTHHLLPAFTALENVLLGMSFGGGRADRGRAGDLLRAVGLGDRLGHRPRQLSVGQRQRVAVARALAGSPRVVLADEPTGALDPSNADAVVGLIRGLCRDAGATLLMVTHDPRLAAGFDRRMELADLNRAAGGAA